MVEQAQAIADRYPQARIAQTRLTEVADVPPDAELTEAFLRLRAINKLGEQYDWLARYARWQGLDDLELCVHRDDKAHAFIADLAVRADRDGDEGYAVPEGPSEAALIFSRFRFPVLETTKLEMEEHARRGGFLDLMDRTWFCHTPTPDGRPCGVCNPCIYTVSEGLARRLPADALRRNKARKRLANRAFRWASRRVNRVASMLGIG